MLKLEEKASEIKKRRKLLDLTQKELAGRSGVSQSLIAKLESGKIEPSYSSVQKIDSFLNLLENIGQKRGSVAKDVMRRHVKSVGMDEKMNKTIKIMWRNGFSQMPVFDEDIPVGCVTEEDIFRILERCDKKNLKKISAKEVMGEGFPIIGENTNISTVKELLKENKAILVRRDKKITGIITKSDFLRT